MSRKLRTLVVASLVGLVGAALSGGQPKDELILPPGPPQPRAYKCLFHLHSVFSDGMRTIDELAEKAEGLGYQAIVVTDHEEQIERQDLKPPLFQSYIGFDSYRAACDLATKPGRLLVIPGVEIAFRWGSSPPSSAHLLAIGRFAPSPERLAKIRSQTGEWQIAERYASILQEEGLIPIAAHPSLIATVHTSPPMKRWAPLIFKLYEEIKDYRWDIAGHRGQADSWNAGIELFNSGPNNALDIAWYRALVAKERPVFVTSGCDSHFPLTFDPEDDARWQRATFVFASRLTETAILTAVRQGRTVATAGPIAEVRMRPIPGFEIHRANPANLWAAIEFSRPLTSAHTMRVWRDGVILTESNREIAKGSRSITYSFIDWKAEPGFHSYVLEIPNLLVSSPIYIAVRGDETFEDFAPAPLRSPLKFGDELAWVTFLSTRGGKLGLWVGQGDGKIGEKILDLDGFEPWFTCKEGRYLLKREGHYYLYVWRNRILRSLPVTHIGKSLMPHPFFLDKDTIAWCDGKSWHALGVKVDKDDIHFDLKPKRTISSKDTKRRLSLERDGFRQLARVDIESDRVLSWLTSGPYDTLPLTQDPGSVIKWPSDLYFASNRGGSFDIYSYSIYALMRADGIVSKMLAEAIPTRRTTSPADETDVCVLSSGGALGVDSVVYVSNKTGYRRIYSLSRYNEEILLTFKEQPREQPRLED